MKSQVKLADPVFVTKPSLPPIEEFIPYLENIWDSHILTNNGPYHQQFEKELSEYLGIDHISLFANGTLALVTALQALKITGEVITTPFSFVATTHALWWNNIKPVFVDIEPEYFTIDPEKIESAITPQTTAILPVHVYGNPCRVEAIQRIADTNGLKVIYDAAHSFGVKIGNNSILNFGDMSVLSFHATKAFNTFEGGAIISKDAEMKRRVDHLKNFGFEDEVTVIGPGINAKMNELQAAFGLLQLKYAAKVRAKRRKIAELYRRELCQIPGISLLKTSENVQHSYTYFPVLVDAKEYGESRDALYERLKESNIFGRRYFYPLISKFPTYRSLKSASKENLPVAEKIANQVICLPIYPDLKQSEILYITGILKDHKY